MEQENNTVTKKKSKDSEVLIYLKSLKPLLVLQDKIRYVVARNYRFLSNPIVEFNTIRLSLIERCGEKGKDERDASAYTLKVDSPNFRQFYDELVPLNEMEHEVELMMAEYNDAVGNLSGEEVLAID